MTSDEIQETASYQKPEHASTWLREIALQLALGNALRENIFQTLVTLDVTLHNQLQTLNHLSNL